MSARTVRLVLRLAAIAIAIAAAVDPVWSIDRSAATPIVVADLTSGTTSDVRGALRNANDAPVVERSIAGRRIPCNPTERCVIVADGSVAAELPADIHAPLLVINNDPAAPNVRVRSAIAASPHASAASSVRIIVDGAQMAGRRTTLRVRDGEAAVGSAVHQWTGDGSATIDVRWWPIAAGPRLLRIEAEPDASETTTWDNAIDLAVQVSNEPLPVLVFDARPSWSSTFVRRALEDDARFVVEHRARLAPALTAATRQGRLDVAALDAAAVVIVGGPDALTENETALLDRFARVRGGTVMLLPEREPRGPVARLFHTSWRERLIAEPQPIGPLRASELLITDNPPVGSTVFGHHDNRAAMILMPAGEGAVLVAGAMDAWRFRDDDRSTFDGFWRSVAAEAAVASKALQIAVDHAPAIPGTRQQFVVTARSMEVMTDVEASAVTRCGADLSAPAHAVRLWPAGSATRFAGELPVGTGPVCEIDVAIGEARARRGIAVAHAPSLSAIEAVAALERSVTKARGTIVRADDVATANLIDVPPSIERASMYPMRSPWWIVPFALCLSGEWWLRRRVGLR